MAALACPPCCDRERELTLSILYQSKPDVQFIGSNLRLLRVDLCLLSLSIHVLENAYPPLRGNCPLSLCFGFDVTELG